MADGRKNNGGVRKGAGRPPKAQERKLIEQLKIYDAKAQKALFKAVDEEKPWAIKMFYQYRWGMPKQIIDQTTTLDTTTFDITKLITFEK